MEYLFRQIQDGNPVDLDAFKRKSWPEVTVTYVRIAAPALYRFNYKSQSPCIILNDLYRLDGETAAAGLQVSRKRDLRGKLTFIAPGGALEGWGKIEKPAAYTIAQLEPSFSRRLPTELGGPMACIEFDDYGLRAVMQRFYMLLVDGSIDIAGYASTLAELAVFDIARMISQNAVKESKGGKGPLSPGVVRGLTAYIEDRLAEDVTVSELAAHVGLNRFYFIHAFKRALGKTPHQYVIQQRVERAKQLLAERSLSISEIALRTGFGDSIQMTRSFKRVLGATPSAIRRSV